MIKIGRIRIKNFKHIKDLELDFSDRDLIVLDGPNGFGKTTIFDAIELVLTGKISRIKNTAHGLTGYESVLFVDDENKNTEIKVEFCTNNRSITIAKIVKFDKKLLPTDKRPDNWEVFETYLLSDFDLEILNGEKMLNDSVSEILGVKDLGRFFSLFYYVQQEENTLFLKQSAKQRMDDISPLFDTQTETMEKKKLSEIKRILNERIQALSGTEGIITTQKYTLETLKVGVSNVDRDNLNNTYFPLINDVRDKKEWDQKDLVINEEIKEKYLAELRNIYSLKQNAKDFINQKFNKEIYEWIDKPEMLEIVVLTYNFVESHEELKKLKDMEYFLVKNKNKLDRLALHNHLDIDILQDFVVKLNLKIDLEDLKETLGKLKSYRQNINQTSEIIRSLNETREMVMIHFNNLDEKQLDSECPLCGYDYNMHSNLIQSIELKSSNISLQLDRETKEYNVLYDSFYSNSIIPILESVNDYLSDNKNIVNEELLKSLSQFKKNKGHINKFLVWCQDNSIDISKFLNTNSNQLTQISVKVRNLIKDLESQLKDVTSDYSKFEDNLTTLNSVFSGDIEKVIKLNLEDIIKKAKYIEYRFYQNNSSLIEKLTKDLSILEKELEILLDTTYKIEKIVKVYDDKITSHWKKIIKDIEIPFYIYSGKIIQNYQRGCGLFIHESGKGNQKSIRFVSDMRQTHDAINYLSSGQLSGLIIAFTLALNKVYGEKTIDIILVDDPVQTMDEINIASLTELLRNEFKTKQLILSTHEEDTSRYIRYKFAKYNLNTLKINIKEKIYSISN